MSYKETVKKKLGLQHWQVVSIYLALYDIVAICASYFIALWFRFDCVYSQIPMQYLIPYVKFIPIYAVICIIVFYALRLYHTIWRFASFNELSRVLMSSVITAIIHVVGITFFFRRMPMSYYVFGALLQFVLVIAVRFSYRFILLLRGSQKPVEKAEEGKRVMIIGAGAAGLAILREIQQAQEIADRVACLIDDNPNKWNRYIEGVPVVGGRDNILYAVGKYGIEKICVAIPSAKADDKREILNICKETGCELQSLPGIYQFVNGEVSVKMLKNVEIEDLLGRDTIKVDLKQIFEELKGKTILVTGGGGSIGSELCRQIAAHEPKQLIIFDIYENNAYAIQQELKKKYPGLNLVVLIGSVRDSRRIYQVFRDYRPEYVYHAAAHKHVPLMEDSPCESIKNNAIGTYKTAYAAMLNGCKRFVLISTDKAVNPTNIMGASKRLCEMIVQTFDKMGKAGRISEIPMLFSHMFSDEDEMVEKQAMSQQSVTDFVAVRFGNVLGSNGSVIPLFKQQIRDGGPVTVTHPDIIRYFMTIPEAVSLVLQAGVYAKGGEIFVLDMGEPMKIDTLARNLIKLSGLRPDIDIKIEYTGLRPGEKLYEEKLMAEEGLLTTPNKLIHIGCPIPFDEKEFLEKLEGLTKVANENDEERVRDKVKEIVVTYKEA